MKDLVLNIHIITMTLFLIGIEINCNFLSKIQVVILWYER